MTIGPIHLTVIRFDGNQFKGEIVPELKAVRKAGIIRLLDLLFVLKDREGNLTSLEVSDLNEGEARSYGSVIGGLIGLGAGGTKGAIIGAEYGALALSDKDYGITPQDVEDIVGGLPDNSSALFILYEHTWAIKLKEAILNAGGGMVCQGLLSPDVLIHMGAELAEAQEAAYEDEDDRRQGMY